MKPRSRVGYGGEMRRSKRELDHQIDRLLTGDHDPQLGEGIAELVTRLQQESAGRAPGGDLASMLAVEAREAESVPSRARHRAHRPLPTRWRRRIMLSTFLSSLLGKLAVGAVALASTTGGLAATGNLPDPAQAWAAEQLGGIGIEIPGPDEAADDTAKDVVDVINNGEYTPEDGEDFGQDVADTASDEKSSDGQDIADDQDANADNAADEADVADGFGDEADNGEVETPEVTTPEQADNGAGNRP